MTGMRQVWAQSPGDIEMLLPWYAAGALNPRDIRRVEQALAGNPALALQQALIREEYAATLDLNESLGVPSPRALKSLFEAIDKEPAQTIDGVPSRLTIATGVDRVGRPLSTWNVPPRGSSKNQRGV